MRSLLKWALPLLLVVLLVVVWLNYPKLNLITGFAAKNVCSCIFVADRELESIAKTDNGFSPVSYATNKIDYQNKSATSTFLGLQARTAVYSPDTGCTLLPAGQNSAETIAVPSRVFEPSSDPYPYGQGPARANVINDVDQDALGAAVDKAFEGEVLGEEASRAILVVHKDQLLLERYAPGFSKQTRFQGWSMTKSLLSAIYGIMQREGRINIEEANLFAQWEGDERAEITLSNLLHMNSGLEWVEDYTTISDVTNMLFLSKDMAKVQIEKQLVGEPGQSWNYSSGTSNLLSGYLRDQFDSPQEYLDFWYQELIDKIGMHSMVLETDWSGNYVGSSYSWATARDWAKFGLLYLNNGNWQGQQLLEPSWIEYTTWPTPGSNGTYGAHFWLNAEGLFPNVPRDMYSANGFQGQHVFIIPSKDLVVVRFGLTESPDFNIDGLLQGIIEAID